MYKEKYIKYKTKYLELKNQLGGGFLEEEEAKAAAWAVAKAPILKNGENKDTPAKKDKAINFYKNITIEDLTYLLKLLKKKRNNSK